ncbi:hypothetical protein MML48_7g00018531 [Holotrichia oblita]|uniref:Uncharacterized protein n=2 Tax=Holotrichia oblita TaxID=644536 RepID=A0ACB9SVE4_HOLOL|nr:hypothetical protein MML48_7g00017866 [Holotrichia oblita]KAI4457631.1 hypothetical protein MML48_7g00018531 [Holotrichia oblita]
MRVFVSEVMEGFLTAEVEDIMCDQVIISTELEVFNNDSSRLSKTKILIAAKLFTNSILPVVVSIYYAYLRNQQTFVDKCRKYFIPAFIACVANSISKSLSSVHRGITYPLTASQKLTEQTAAPPTEIVDDAKPEKSVECIVLTEPKDITVDVIFIHGLHGSLVKTWRQGDWRHDNHHLRKSTLERRKSEGNFSQSVERNILLQRSYSEPYSTTNMDDGGAGMELNLEENSENVDEPLPQEYSKCWPKDWIPQDCPGARAIALNYTTDPYLWRPLWIKKRNRTSMTERSQEMIEHLLKIGVGKHPIVWVGHSKGGLFVKQIILDACESENADIKGLYEQTKSILFYSVPHKGSILADVTLPFLKRSVELTEIQRNCPFVLELHRKFVDMLERTELNPDIFSFIETSYTFMSFIFLKIVAFESCDPGRGYICGVPLDHREICKPAGRDCFLYQELIRLLKKSEMKID